MDTILVTLRDSQGFLSALPDDEDVQEALKKATSFRPVGYQYTAAFKHGRTDGRVKLLKGQKFPAGLLNDILAVFRKHNVPFHIHHEKSEVQRPDISVEPYGIESRPYQDMAVQAADLYPRGTIQVPTGGGKTAIQARVIAAKNKHTLVVVPTIDLLYQTKAFLEQHLAYGPGDWDTGAPITVGQLGDGVVDPLPITVATVRTAATALGIAYESYEFGEYDDKDDTEVSPAKLRQFFADIGMLMVDEAHILGAQTVYDLATKLPAPNKYGFSASPWRDDGADLMITAATGHKIYKVSTSELVQDKWLVPPLIQTIDTKGWWEPESWGQVCNHCGRQRWMTDKGWVKKCACGSERWRSEFTQAYKHEIVDNPVRNAMIAQRVRELPGATLVLVKQVNHGRSLKALIEGSEFLSGRDSSGERNRVFQAMREGQVRVLVATTIADMGLDLPILQNLVLAGVGKSSVRHLQRIGRVARPYPGKEFARVVDFDDSHVHSWFKSHLKARRKIERSEWGAVALWV